MKICVRYAIILFFLLVQFSNSSAQSLLNIEGPMSFSSLGKGQVMNDYIYNIAVDSMGNLIEVIPGRILNYPDTLTALQDVYIFENGDLIFSLDCGCVYVRSYGKWKNLTTADDLPTETHWSNILEIPADIADGDQRDDADADPQNEIQSLEEVLSINNSAGSQRISNLSMPIFSNDAANKLYVDLMEASIQEESTEVHDGNTINFSLSANTISGEIIPSNIQLSTLQNDAGFISNEIDGSISNEIQNAQEVLLNTPYDFNSDLVHETEVESALLALNDRLNLNLDSDPQNEIQTLDQVLSHGANAGGLSITNLATPLLESAAVNKQYVDDLFLTINANELTVSDGIGIDLSLSNDTLHALIIPSALSLSSFNNDAGFITVEQDGSSSNELQNLENVLGINNSANNQKIINLGFPTESSDAATKNYVDIVYSTFNQESTSVQDGISLDLNMTNGVISGEVIPSQILTSSLSNDAGFINAEIDGSITNEWQNAEQVDLVIPRDIDGDLQNENTVEDFIQKLANVVAADNDNDPTNEIETWSSLSGKPDGFMDNIDNVDDADANPTNELQTLSEVLSEGSDAGTNRISNLSNPINNQDAATKSYVDNAIVINGGEATTVSDGISIDFEMNGNDISAELIQSAIFTSSINNDAGFIQTEVDGSVTNEIQNAKQVLLTDPDDVDGDYIPETNVEDFLTALHLNQIFDLDEDPTNEIQDLRDVLSVDSDAGGLKIRNLGQPLLDSDAATKSYVDNQLGSSIYLNDGILQENRIFELNANSLIMAQNGDPVLWLNAFTGNYYFGDVATNQIIEIDAPNNKFKVSTDSIQFSNFGLGNNITSANYNLGIDEEGKIVEQLLPSIIVEQSNINVVAIESLDGNLVSQSIYSNTVNLSHKAVLHISFSIGLNNIKNANDTDIVDGILRNLGVYLSVNGVRKSIDSIPFALTSSGGSNGTLVLSGSCFVNLDAGDFDLELIGFVQGGSSSIQANFAGDNSYDYIQVFANYN